MRFHFGTCRHDEAQANWDELCRLKDVIKQQQSVIHKLNDESKDLLSQTKEMQCLKEKFAQRATDSEKLRKQHQSALDKIKHLQEVIDDLNKRPPYLFKPVEKQKEKHCLAHPDGVSFIEEKPIRTRKSA